MSCVDTGSIVMSCVDTGRIVMSCADTGKIVMSCADTGSELGELQLLNFKHVEEQCKFRDINDTVEILHMRKYPQNRKYLNKGSSWIRNMTK